MLMFKDGESFSTAYRHFGHRISTLASDHAEHVFDLEACKKSKKMRDNVLAIVDENCNEFKKTIMRLAEDIATQMDEPRLVSLRLSSMYADFLRTMTRQLWDKYHGTSDKFDDALVEFATTLNAVNVQQFIQLSRDKKHEKLALMLEEKRLTLWAQNFRYDEWKEASLKNEILHGLPDVVSSVLENEMQIEADEEKPDLRVIENKILIIIETEFFDDYLAQSLRDVSDARLVANDSLAKLQATIPEVIDNIIKRLNSYMESNTREEIGTQFSEIEKGYANAPF